MRKEIKNEILDAAKALFIAKGYHGVSLQDIADAVGISKGNLTYHFNKKETVMEALISRNGERKHPAIPCSLQDLDYVFLDMQQAVECNAYYFMHHAELSQLSTKIAELQAEAYRESMELFRQGFIKLRESEVIREELFAGEYDCAIDALHMTFVYWQPYSQLRKNENVIDGCHRQAWSIIYPLLTEKGLLEIKLIEDFGKENN